MLDSAGSVAFSVAWAAMMRNAGIEVTEALKVNLMRVFCAVWTCVSIVKWS